MQPILGAPNFIKHTLVNLKTQIDPNTVEVGAFNTPLSPTDRSSRQKINRGTLEFSIPSCNSIIYILLSSP
jgi:hypothetical protein